MNGQINTNFLVQVQHKVYTVAVVAGIVRQKRVQRHQHFFHFHLWHYCYCCRRRHNLLLELLANIGNAAVVAAAAVATNRDDDNQKLKRMLGVENAFVEVFLDLPLAAAQFPWKFADQKPH